ncbi:MAG: alpha/beta hydrolase [Sphingobium sp.]
MMARFSTTVRLLGAMAVAVSPLVSVLAQPGSPGAIAPAEQRPYLTLAQLRAKYRDPAGRIALIKGVEIYYKDEGKGPVLLMVHGSASSLRTWDVVANQLKNRYRIIRFDVASMGLSGAVSDDVAATVTPVDIATGLLDKLGVRKVTYVGVSSGGTLGMFLAAKRPDMVQRLILANTPADPVKYDHMVQPESFIKAQADAKANGGFQSQTFWNEYLTYFAGDPKRISAAKRSEYYDFNRRVPEKNPVALVAQIKDGVIANQLMAQVTAPTLLIWGGKDQLLTHAAMKSLEAHLPKAQVSEIILPDVGHYPPLEAPQRFAQLIDAYVQAAVPD